MKKRILMHVCCAPCFVAPYAHINEKFDVYAFWYNHNIHPYQEYHKRFMAFKEFCQDEKINMISKDEYDLNKFLQDACFREEKRCYSCYYERLKYAVIIAKKGNFDYFSSTLLYSKYQDHQLIIDIAESLSKKYGVPFYYEDFREYWKEGIEISKNKDMYRQQYCGCIYSEKDRYHNQLKKLHEV